MSQRVSFTARLATAYQSLVSTSPEEKFRWAEYFLIGVSALNQLCWRHAADPTGQTSVGIPILLMLVLALVNALPVASGNGKRILQILIELVLIVTAGFLGGHRIYRHLYFIVIGKAALRLNTAGLIFVSAAAMIQQIVFVLFVQRVPPRLVLMFPGLFARQTVLSSEYVIYYTFVLLLVIFISILLRSEQESRHKAEAMKLEMDTLSLSLERERIARDIHDSLGHALTGLNVQLQLAQKLQTIDVQKSHDAVALARGFASRAAADVRRAVRAVRDSHFDFPAAVEELVETIESGGSCRATVSIDPVLMPSQLSHNIFFLIQESLTNVQRHSQATTVLIELTGAEEIVLHVKDNGIGYSAHDSVPGFGIKGMEERVSSLGGTMKIDAPVGAGTDIIIRIQIQLKFRRQLMIKVLVVDDEAIVRQGIASLLMLEPDLEIVGQAQNGLIACELASSLKPDVILMDIRMPLCDGLQALQKILSKLPTMKVVMLTTFDDDSMIGEALQLGAAGYLLKDTDSAKIATAIRVVSQGLALLNAPVLKKLARSMGGPDNSHAALIGKLSAREVEVLRLIGQGKNNKKIATELFLSEGTVKNYVSRIFDVLGVRNRSEATVIALEQRKALAGDDDSPYVFS